MLPSHSTACLATDTATRGHSRSFWDPSRECSPFRSAGPGCHQLPIHLATPFSILWHQHAPPSRRMGAVPAQAPHRGWGPRQHRAGAGTASALLRPGRGPGAGGQGLAESPLKGDRASQYAQMLPQLLEGQAQPCPGKASQERRLGRHRGPGRHPQVAALTPQWGCRPPRSMQLYSWDLLGLP